MKRPRFQWNPITRKRLQRFRQTRRAWWSFCILAALYLLSLGSELLCNRDPLYVRYRGRSYFPVFRFYPEDVFTGNGRDTRPNYKAIDASAAFHAETGNRMLFPPLRWGPNEIIPAASIRIAPAVQLVFTRATHAGTVNVRPDFTVFADYGGGYFLDRSDAGAAGVNFTNLWRLDAPVLTAVAVRFQNRPAEAVRGTAVARRDPHRVIRVTLSGYEPRAAPPVSVRLTLADEPGAAAPAHVMVSSNRAVIGPAPAIWQALEAAQRGALLAAARQRFTAPVDALTLTVQGADYRVAFEKRDVTWPYPPTRGHWLGIDSAGRDVLARILYGLRISMTFGLLLVLGSLALGIVIGAVQGYYGGLLDLSAQRLIEVWSALPFLYIMILLGSIYGRSFLLLLVCYGIFNWIGISYYMRAEFLRLRKLQFVDAARCLGVPNRGIIFRHILPNALVPVITFFPFMLVGAIGSLAALDYLGFGLPPPTPSWGDLLQQAQQFRWAWWLILYPALALFAVMLLGVLVGEGVRQAYDPQRFTHLE